MTEILKVCPELVDRLQSLSFSLSAGGLQETDPVKLLSRIEWGVEFIQQVETKRAADLVEELSKTPKATWGEVKAAILARAFPAPVREHAANFGAETARLTDDCSRSGSPEQSAITAIARRKA